MNKGFLSLPKEDRLKIETAVKITKTPLLEKLINAEHTAETTDSRFYLTETGRIIARGAIKMYPEIVE